MSNQSAVQASCRASTGKVLDYNGDWHAVFDAAGIPAGSFNGRLLAWINVRLGSSHGSLAAAQQAFAESQGYNNWSSMGTITVA